MCFGELSWWSMFYIQSHTNIEIFLTKHWKTLHDQKSSRNEKKFLIKFSHLKALHTTLNRKFLQGVSPLRCTENEVGWPAFATEKGGSLAKHEVGYEFTSAARKVLTFEVKISEIRGQLHQHSMRSFYVRKLSVQLFCAYILGLYFTGVSLPAQKLNVERWWNWALGAILQKSTVKVISLYDWIGYTFCFLCQRQNNNSHDLFLNLKIPETSFWMFLDEYS